MKNCEKAGISLMNEEMYTPWGVAQSVELLDDGVFWVQPQEHGGLLIESSKAETLLSAKAIAIGKVWNTFLTFEEDDAMLVVFYEHPELYPWAEEELIHTLAEECLHRVYPDYFNESLPVLADDEIETVIPDFARDGEAVPM